MTPSPSLKRRARKGRVGWVEGTCQANVLQFHSERIEGKPYQGFRKEQTGDDR